MKDHGSNRSAWAVIMAGGLGTRLWPESTKNCPKQFLPLDGEKTLVERCVERVDPLFTPDRTLVVGGKIMKGKLRRLLPDLDKSNFLWEPCSRNTAAAIAWAAVDLVHRDPDAIMVVLPSDHYIDGDDCFRKTIRFGLDLVRISPKSLITIGIEPNEPRTGFGYIERGDWITDRKLRSLKKTISCFQVNRFKEKPSLAVARKYLRSGRYFWNSGIFIWRADRILDLLRDTDPIWSDFIESVGQKKNIEKAYSALQSISIDYAIMERAESVKVLSAPFGWDDLGSFRALARLDNDRKDEAGNIARGCSLITRNAKNNLVRVSGNKNLQIALLGVDDLLVIQSGDRLLIASKEKENEIGQIINEENR